MTRVNCVCIPHGNFQISLYYKSDGRVTSQAASHRRHNVEFGSDIMTEVSMLADGV